MITLTNSMKVQGQLVLPGTYTVKFDAQTSVCVLVSCRSDVKADDYRWTGIQAENAYFNHLCPIAQLQSMSKHK